MPRRTSTSLLVAAAIALALIGCASGDDEPSGGDGTTTAPASSSTTASTTTTSTAPETSAPSEPTAVTDEAADAANELLAAWRAGDQARARAIAPGEVVDALFLVAPEGYGIYGCDTGEFEFSSCNLRNRATGGYINVSMIRTDGGWQVDTVYVGQD